MTVKARPQSPRRFTPEQVRFIRQMAEKGNSMSALARRFRVSRSAIRSIVTYSSYKDIK